MNKEKLKKISKNLSANSDDFMSAFRKNMFMYIDEKDITIKDISEESCIPFSTLNTLLYGNSKDIKWENKSRSLSWTPEKKALARQKTLEQHKLRRANNGKGNSN